MSRNRSSPWTILFASALCLAFAACDGGEIDDHDGDAGAGGSAGSTHTGTGGTAGNPSGGGSGGEDPGTGGTGGEDPGTGGTGGDEPGPGGSGGQGSGGTGGTGGRGGSGGTGGSGGAVELEECFDVGAIVEQRGGSLLVCADGIYPQPRWLFACEYSDHCPNDFTFCAATVLGEPFCLPNRCGKGESIFPNAENGDFFEACNPEDGVSIIYDERGNVLYEAPEFHMTGTCLPLGRSPTGRAEGYCAASGFVPPGGDCAVTPGGGRMYGSMCEQGSTCTTDGTCAPVCDASRRTSAEFSRCSDPSASCELGQSNPPTDYSVGLCLGGASSACDEMCDQVYGCGWGFGFLTVEDCYDLCSEGAFDPADVSCVRRVQGCGPAALAQVQTCMASGPACTDEFDTSPQCEACVEDALAECNSAGGACATVWGQFADCAVAAGCGTTDCGIRFCPTQWDRYTDCITDRCDEYWACFP